MADKVVNLSISRVSGLFPCNFMLIIAAMNPCVPADITVMNITNAGVQARIYISSIINYPAMC